MTEYRADWYPDPARRFEFRYHNGHAWTADVSTSGQRYVDPLHGQPPPAGQFGATPPAAQPGRNGMAIAALVLGICGLATAWLPYVFALGAISSLLALVFGRIGLQRSAPTGAGRGPAIAGLITGGLGCLAAVGGFFFTLAVSDAIDEYENPGRHEISIDSCVETPGERSVWTASGTITNRDSTPEDFTIEIVFSRAGTNNVQRIATVVVRDVAPGERRAFEVARSTSIADIDCSVESVRGPTPFGIPLD